MVLPVNPALICSIAAVAARRSASYGSSMLCARKEESREPWLKRRKRAMLLKRLRRDAQIKAMGKDIDEDRNERLWDEYFALG